MARACPKCGYENPATEAPDSEKCPKCGLIYSKFEAVAERRAEEAQQKEAEARQKAEVDTIEAEKRMKEQQEKQKQEEASRPKVVVKTYKGTQTYAIALFNKTLPS